MNKVTEEWRPVVGWEGFYTVSSLGRIRSETRPIVNRCGHHRTIKGKPRRFTKSNDYYIVCLSRNGDNTWRFVHQLVAEAFVGPRPYGREAHHRDGDKMNNAAGNLEWVTASENQRHAIDSGLKRIRRGEESHMSRLTAQEVREIRSCQGIRRGVEVAKAYGVASQTVYGIWHGRSWRHLL